MSAKESGAPAGGRTKDGVRFWVLISAGCSIPQGGVPPHHR
jgi:hypothetical protein